MSTALRVSPRFRAWWGYRLIFQGVQLPLDHELIPTFRMPKMSDSQILFAELNCAEAFGPIPPRAYPFYMISLAASRFGILEHPFALQLSQPEIKNMFERYRKFMRTDHEAQFRALTKFSDFDLQQFEPGKLSKLLLLILSNKITIVAALLYHTQVAPIDLTPLRQTMNGLLHQHMARMLATLIRLQERYRIVEKLLRVRQELLEADELFTYDFEAMRFEID